VAGFWNDGTKDEASLGNLVSVGDSERRGITLALEQAITRERDRIRIFTDSMTALSTALNLSRGDPPRSGIESAFKDALICLLELLQEIPDSPPA